MTSRLGPVETAALRLPSTPGSGLSEARLDLGSWDTSSTPGCSDKVTALHALEILAPVLADLQERLWAARTTGSNRRVLVVLQGMDTSGKGGVIRNALGLVDPRGLQITGFGAPTAEERRHDFLWRIRRALPTPGHIGVFDRSHYEDVLIQKVESMAPPEEIERRYASILDFESELVASGVTVIKVMLHISAREQAKRLLARLQDPSKHWKYAPSDIDARARWGEYQHAHEVALERTHTDAAPWYVVPADRKWFRNLAVAQIVAEALDSLDLGWPLARFDVEAEQARLNKLVLK